MSRRVDAMYDSIYYKEPDAERRMRDAERKLNGVVLNTTTCTAERDSLRVRPPPDTAARATKPSGTAG
jgi:hypothetical protein